MENIIVTKKKVNLGKNILQKKKMIQITGFDLAMCFEKDNRMVRQSLYTEDMQFAPEIVAGKEHDVAVDVWGLGRIIL